MERFLSIMIILCSLIVGLTWGPGSQMDKRGVHAVHAGPTLSMGRGYYESDKRSLLYDLALFGRHHSVYRVQMRMKILVVDVEYGADTTGSFVEPKDGRPLAFARDPELGASISGFQLNIGFVHQLAENWTSSLRGTSPPTRDEACTDRSAFTKKVSEPDKMDVTPPPERHADHVPCSALLHHLPQSKATEIKRVATTEHNPWIST
ncbi:uncharacterized protein BCR38DRAFT_480145 [Pseudomassariella vexata]|uniref:Uncharacterized protein n=1 Tax=Pseudomassariella vexata TaxID=1141098 RepID=A0A1Y2EJI4_9PEZI|nr:uncharacterized protein BCR38DRAFT_480145 [Pseudomassariella vexata]ORY71647.1 hypothetical protein BCR38DRAFT_480145 [Pseudomassariella vexata]